jgi:hypothetical protein
VPQRTSESCGAALRNTGAAASLTEAAPSITVPSAGTSRIAAVLGGRAPRWFICLSGSSAEMMLRIDKPPSKYCIDMRIRLV